MVMNRAVVKICDLDDSDSDDAGHAVDSVVHGRIHNDAACLWGAGLRSARKHQRYHHRHCYSSHQHTVIMQ